MCELLVLGGGVAPACARVPRRGNSSTSSRFPRRRHAYSACRSWNNGERGVSSTSPSTSTSRSSTSTPPARTRTTAHAHAGPPWDAKMFREWAAINHFSDNDLEIDEKTKALQRSISRFEKTYYGISILYWSLWLAALLSGNALLTKISSFSVFCWAMLASSFSFSAYFLARMIKAVGRPHDLVAALQTDMSGLNRYSWRTLFWLGFALFYVAPTSAWVARYLGSFGVVMCGYGLVLVASSALLIKTWTFMGDPNIPMNLITVGPYALLRHPQALGNLLFVCGFALTGGSTWSALAFLAAGALYVRNIVPVEEMMLAEAFPNSYTHYCERVPRFSGALLLLLVLQTVMMIRYGVGGGAY